jgi:hypothetical protein
MRGQAGIGIRGYAFLAAVVILLGLAGGQDRAGAAAIAEGPDRYQRWLEEIRAPAPAVELKVHEARCPFARGSDGCTTAAGEVWIRPGRTRPRLTFLHELGHHYAWHYLDAGERRRFQRAIGRPGRFEEEILAEQYARCAGPAEWGRDRGLVTRRQHRRSCSLIRGTFAAATSSGLPDPSDPTVTW